MEFVNSSPNPIHACVCAAVSVWLCGYVAVTLQHMTLQLTSTAYWFAAPYNGHTQHIALGAWRRTTAATLSHQRARTIIDTCAS